MNQREFEELMETIAKCWNTKNSRAAVACFTADAVYIEPPDKQLIRGRSELYEYFGGDTGFDMKLTWHNLFFNEDTQSGAGEYTFEMKGKVHHGVAIIELEKGKVRLWREYDMKSNLSYADFLKIEGKDFQFTAYDLSK